MSSPEDDRAQWLSQANTIIEDWQKQTPERGLSPVLASMLADRIAESLQRAYKLGRIRAGSEDDCGE